MANRQYGWRWVRKWVSTKWVRSGLAAFFLFWFILQFSAQSPDANLVQDVSPTAEPVQQPKRLKKILFWNNKYNMTGFGFGVGQEPFVRAGCPVTNCFTTHDRTQLNESDALIFFVLGFNESDLPAHRQPHQRYIFNLYETMAWSKTYGNIPLFRMDNFFNWTMTYRRDSDIFEPQPHGLLRAKKHIVNDRLPSDLEPNGTLARPDQLLRYQSRPEVRKRTKLVAWFCSHLGTESKRDVYFNELAKYAPIDIYGKCGNLTCTPGPGSPCDRLLEHYKFYVAAENSLCPDYVTEKFYRALDIGVVPIVYGGADYARYGPPHSYVNVADFRSPKELAEYLLLLDRNDALYSEYFRWKSDFVVDRFPQIGWCQLCQKLNDPNEPVKVYKSISQYWHHDVPCLDGATFLSWVLPNRTNQ